MEIGFYLYWYHIVYIFFAFYSILVFHSIGKNVLVFIVILTVYSLLTYQYSFWPGFKTTYQFDLCDFCFVLFHKT